jgi:di/tricarboxylate transporter
MLPEPHAIAAMAVTLIALILFTRQKIPLEYSCVAILFVLVLGFELFPYQSEQTSLRGVEFMRGFGNEALITICLLLILGKGLEISGALRPVGRVLVQLWLRNRTLALLATLVVAAFVSAFANNTPIVVMLLPILVGVAHRIGVAPSRILIPVGYATIIGGMSTTIGTSTNLLVVGVSADLGVPRLEMFDFVLPAVIAGSAAILYLWLIAPRLLPDRPSPLEGSAPRIFDAVIEVTDDSPFAGQTLADVMRLMQGQIRVERVLRGKSLELARLPTLKLRVRDRLHVRGSPDAIKKLQDSIGDGFSGQDLRRAPDQRLVEIVVTAESPLHKKRLSELRSATLGKLFPVGVHRPGRQRMTLIEEGTDPLLRTGDVLLMQGDRRDIQLLKETHNMLILDRTIHVPRSAKALLAASLMIGVVVVAAFGILPIMASALCGVGLMLLGRCLAWDEAWSAIDTRLVLVIVTSLALGATLAATGAAEYIADAFVTLVRDLPPPVVLSLLLLLTAMLTEVITNNAVAVIATPIAVAIANTLGLPPTPFVLAVLFGANMAYMMPIGYQTNLLVMSAGGYKFTDFFRTGIPLQLIMWIMLSIALPVLYL